MRHAKDGEWWVTDPQRALSNNSACYTEKPTMNSFMQEWISLYRSKSGERGIFNREAAVEKARSTGRRDPDHLFLCNPCLPGWVMVVSPEGSIPLSSVEIGDKIWSETGWTTVIDKWSSGIKDVFEYATPVGSVFCTQNHRLIQNGEKVEASYCRAIDKLALPGDDTAPESLPIVLRDYHSTEEVFDITVDNEPHTFWCNGFNVSNCSEIILRPCQMCNLSEVVVRAEDTPATLREKVELASVLGTMQATLTDFRYLRSIWQKNTIEEALLGVSLTGIYDNRITAGENPGKLRKLLGDLKQVSIDTNIQYAAKLGINQAAAITCVKPSGTVSQLCDCASGIHPRYSKYYIRRVRCDRKDPLCKFLVACGLSYEPDGTSEENWVFEFPMRAPEGGIVSADITAVRHLEMWKLYNEAWCEHKPSITVTVREDEWMHVGAWVYEHFNTVSGVSFLPHLDHIYRQAPYEECDKATYDRMVSKIPKTLDWSKLSEYESGDSTKASQTLACSGTSCELVDVVK
jgi:hypothetical protein